MRAVLALFFAASCGQPAAPAAVPADAELAAIADRCGLPREALRLTADGNVQFQPDPEERFETVDCAFRELRRSDRLKDLPMGFVGNDRLEPK